MCHVRTLQKADVGAVTVWPPGASSFATAAIPESYNEGAPQVDEEGVRGGKGGGEERRGEERRGEERRGEGRGGEGRGGEGRGGEGRGGEGRGGRRGEERRGEERRGEERRGEERRGEERRGGEGRGGEGRGEERRGSVKEALRLQSVAQLGINVGTIPYLLSSAMRLLSGLACASL